MIQKNKIKDLVVFTDENNSKYLNVLNDFLSYDINIIKVFRSIDDTKVMLIDTDYGKLILKVFSPKVKRNERFFKSLLKGDYYERLFEHTQKVRNEGYILSMIFICWQNGKHYVLSILISCLSNISMA
ncbi:lipopolysaccharide core heptose(II) kinase rfaY [Escherichia coli DEC6A]|nr:lipopolysaccharide core heptose(II) kinase rfaY [Escherichia coli DEC6A]